MEKISENVNELIELVNNGNKKLPEVSIPMSNIQQSSNFKLPDHWVGGNLLVKCAKLMEYHG